jgi:hypothetical protein
MRAVQLVEVPEQAAFRIRAAAKYLGISANVLRKKADLGLIRCGYDENGHRVFLLEDLDAYRKSLLKNRPRQEYNCNRQPVLEKKGGKQ